MSDIELTQAEADAFIAAEKHCVDSKEWEYPMFGGKLVIPLISPVDREEYLLDIYRHQINLTKATYQNRVRRMIVLVRLDLGGPTHRNPDGAEIPCPHIHIYREGFGDKWALPLPVSFSDASNMVHSLNEFMAYCNITVAPTFKTGLFA